MDVQPWYFMMEKHTHKAFTNEKGIAIGPYSYDEYVERVKSFHGAVAPGVAIGGFMVDLALRNLPKGEVFDAVSETRRAQVEPGGELERIASGLVREQRPR